MSETERRFLVLLEKAAPGASGYGDRAGRTETDSRLRAALTESLMELRGRLAELMGSAEEEGEEDMRDDLERIDARMERTAMALSDEAHAGTAFFTREEISAADRERVYAYDLQLLQDMELLHRDVMGMKYETIGNLTLREAEGTLAAIELRVANRKDVLEGGEI
jgi:hypothetical protein